MYLIGIDVGGTTVKLGLIKNNSIVARLDSPTNYFDLVKQIINLVYEILQKNNLTINELSGIGVGCPGLVKDGIVYKSCNLNLSNCNLALMLAQEFKVDVIVKNDAEMATLAEHRLGAGEGVANMIMLTIGTGVGGGIITNGKLYEGNLGSGELGHITFQVNGLPCNCGRKGCLEQYISIRGIDKIARRILRDYPMSEIQLGKDLIQISKVMERYDTCKEAKIIIDGYVELLSEGVLNYCNIFRPDKIVIGGGLAYSPKVIEMVAELCAKKKFGYENSPNVEIVPAALSNDAGILGTVVAFGNY